ncbi:MAG: DUF2344 domain-containing protein [Chloroflexi bacterium]|nr:DUF2344 domain-containing protein [Chloroflexota bacterium]
MAGSNPVGSVGDNQEDLLFSRSLHLIPHLCPFWGFGKKVKKAGIPVKFSQGFHPHPKFSFATALSVGVESSAEYLDIDVSDDFTPESLKTRLNRALPAGITVLAAWDVPAGSPSLSTIIDRVRYRVTLPEGVGGDLALSAERFLARESCPFRRVKKNGPQEYDLRHELTCLSADGANLTMEIGRGKPLEFVAAITGLPPEELGSSRIEKLDVIFKDSSFHL